MHYMSTYLRKDPPVRCRLSPEIQLRQLEPRSSRGSIEITRERAQPVVVNEYWQSEISRQSLSPPKENFQHSAVEPLNNSRSLDVSVKDARYESTKAQSRISLKQILLAGRR